MTIPDSDSGRPEESAFERLRELHERYEPLRPELQQHLEQTRFGYFLIRHPFCNQTIIDLERCAMVHHIIDKHTAKADACFEAQDWEGYLGCVEIYSQPKWLAKDAHLLPDERYWALLGQAYRHQKFTYGYRDLFESLFSSNRPGRENLMEPDERALLARFPDKVTVFRGFWDDEHDEDFSDGNAWTLDRRAAVWFANRCWTKEHGHPMVVEGVVKKDDILAFWPSDDVVVPFNVVRPVKFKHAGSKRARVSWDKYISPPFDVEEIMKKA